MSVEGVGNIGIAMICVLVALLIPAAIFDLRSRRIPNWLCLVGLVLGLVVQVGFAGLSGAGESLGGMAVALAIGFLLFAVGWLGAGDAKLLAAIGAVVGLSHIFEFLVAIVFSGGLVAVVALLVRGVLPSLLKRWWVTLALTLSARRLTQVPAAEVEAVEIPYAVSIALGAVIAVLVSQLWTV